MPRPCCTRLGSNTVKAIVAPCLRCAQRFNAHKVHVGRELCISALCCVLLATASRICCCTIRFLGKENVQSLTRVQLKGPSAPERRRYVTAWSSACSDVTTVYKGTAREPHSVTRSGTGSDVPGRTSPPRQTCAALTRAAYRLLRSSTPTI